MSEIAGVEEQLEELRATYAEELVGPTPPPCISSSRCSNLRSLMSPR
jgi:hypothetical protein